MTPSKAKKRLLLRFFLIIMFREKEEQTNEKNLNSLFIISTPFPLL